MILVSQMLLVGASLMLGHWLELNKVDWMSEAGASLIVGILVGAVLKVAPFSTEYESVFHFSVRPSARLRWQTIDRTHRGET